MKSLLSSLILLPVSLTLADVAVYQGSQVVKTTSSAGTQTRVEKFIQVVDLDLSQIVTLTLSSGKGPRTFAVSAPADIVQTVVADSRGGRKTSTVFAQALTSTDPATGVVRVSSFLQKGRDGFVVIKTGETVSLPRNLQGEGAVVSTESTAPGTPVPAAHVDLKSVLVLQDAASRASNDAAETLAAAVERVKASLVAQGYTERVP